MVCNRCILVVRNEMEKLNLQPIEVELGEVLLEHEPSTTEKTQLKDVLESLGFELIDDKKSRIIEKIKSIIIASIQNEDDVQLSKLSVVLSETLHHDYNYLSNLFSEVEGTTIEKYQIALKIEKAKELLVYDELTLTEIAERLQYSSVAYLSNQFKKITGLTPSHFKKISQKKRKPLDEV